MLGGVLLSHTLAGAVPSALPGLASGFGMDAGRLPAAMTTETTEQAARNDRRLWCGYSIIHAQPPTHTTLDVWPGGWVGCGPYSGRSRYCGCPPLTARGMRVLCVGGCCLCRPISTSQLEAVTGLPLLAYQPSSLLGAYQDTEVSCGDLISKMVSRLDAFSGYPSRT